MSYSNLIKHICIQSMLLLLSLPLLANTEEQYKVNGGVIVLANGNCPSEELCFPTTKIDVFDSVAGNKLGSIGRANRFELSLNLPSDISKALSKQLIWHRELSYDSNALGFITLKRNFALIAQLGEQQLWFDTEALKEAGYSAFRWPQFLTKYKGAVYPAELLSLRAGPSIAAKKLAVITAISEVTFTGKFNGFWAELKVKIYDKHLCEGDAKMIAQYTGWVKYYDEKTDVLNFELGGSC